MGSLKIQNPTHLPNPGENLKLNPQLKVWLVGHKTLISKVWLVAYLWKECTQPIYKSCQCQPQRRITGLGQDQVGKLSQKLSFLPSMLKDEVCAWIKDSLKFYQN